ASLISRDPSLIDSVSQAIGPLANLRFENVETIDQLGDQLEDGEPIALAILHLTEQCEFGRVEELVDKVGAGNRAVATVVVSDEGKAEHALAALRLGVADYLDRPLDLGRLAYLADVLTVKQRFQPDVVERDRAVGAAVVLLGEREPYLYAPSSPMRPIIEQ